MYEIILNLICIILIIAILRISYFIAKIIYLGESMLQSILDSKQKLIRCREEINSLKLLYQETIKEIDDVIIVFQQLKVKTNELNKILE